jgi:two-component system C4-dicarboxylate transport sensor histidine kinase DctB
MDSRVLLPGWRRLLLVLVPVLVCCAFVGALAYQAALQHYSQTQLQQAEQRSAFYALSLQSELARHESLPRLAAFEHTLAELLAAPNAAPLRATANLYLENIQRSADISAAFLIDAHGVTLAASNWNQPSSFVGQNYAFRPYFHEAMSQGFGRFYAIGSTTGTPGYFLAAPIRAHGRALGAVAVKASLAGFEQALAKSGDTVLLADNNGVIFLSSRPAWKYRTLAELNASVRARLRSQRQYGDYPLTPLDATASRPAGAWPETLRAMLPGSRAQRYRVQYRPVGRLGWQLALLVDLRPERQSALLAGSGAGLATALAIALILLARLRQKRFEERRRAREALQRVYSELEQRIAARTAELSAANSELAHKVEALDRAQSILRQTRDSAVQAGKLAVLGQMAAGITHELNQPLAALNTLADNAVLLLERGEQIEARDNLSLISQLAGRMGRIVAHIKAFARKGEGERERVLVADALRQALVLVEPRRKQLDARIELTQPQEALAVWASLVRLEQVLVNLLMNGLDAMADSPRERLLTIAVSAHGSEVRIAITDHGPGIAKEALARLFEPFYTTKPAGQGLGLGLAISQAIVEDFNGRLEAGNSPGQGARFGLVLERAS